MERVYGFDSHDTFAIGALEIPPFPVPHDAREPVQYVIGDGARRVGVLTDLGVSTPHVEACLSGCDALVLECNHDLDLLRERQLPVAAEAAHRGPSRPSRQRGRGGAAGRDSTRRSLVAHHRRAPVAARTTRRSSRARRLRTRSAARATGSASPTRTDGFGWREL